MGCPGPVGLPTLRGRLEVMEGRLERDEFFVADRYSIADVALYAYTHVADEGGFDLGRFPPSVPGWSASGRSRGTYP